MNKKFFKKILYPLSYLNKLVEKNEKKILLYSNLGFRDNVKSIFDYLINNGYNKKYQIICSLDDYENYTDNQIKNVKFISNIQGVHHYLTSKYCFYCFGKYPIKPSKKQIVINLWHGMPLKKIGNMESNYRKEDFNYFTHVLSTAPFFSPFMMEAFNCRQDQVLISGQPRNDELFVDNNVKEIFNISDYKKVIVWLPTFRVSTRLNLRNHLSKKNTELSFPIVDDKTKMTKLNNLLALDNSILLIKPHPMQDLVESDLVQYSNVRIVQQQDLNEKSISIYNLLKEADALLTDYSSVYFDYLLLNRPIGFTIDDINEYKESRGFVVDDPLEVMPGEKVKNYDDFIRFIEKIIDEDDKYANERHKINNLCNTYKDGNSSKRIIEFCGITLD
jgi:CDP-glycerol glycerophosphotransferase (TagB/SpsB family)